MAVATLDFYLRPEDGWTLVATSPAMLIVKPAVFHPWWVAVTPAGAPAADLIGVPMGNNSHDRMEAFEATGVTGDVYVRVQTPPASYDGSKFHFGVIRDQ